MEEETRLRSLSNVLNAAGFEPMLYEDFADEVFGLIRKVANAQQEGNAEDVLLEAFNDEMVQNYVITHFKVRHLEVCHASITNYCPDSHGCMDEDSTSRLCTLASRSIRRRVLQRIRHANQQRDRKCWSHRSEGRLSLSCRHHS